MPKNVENLEKIDVATPGKFMLWLKRIAYIVTIITTISGGVLGVFSFLKEHKDPTVKAGYIEHSSVLKSHAVDIRDNRQEIARLYRYLLAASETSGSYSTGPTNDVEKKLKDLESYKSKQPRAWDQIQRQAPAPHPSN